MSAITAMLASCLRGRAVTSAPSGGTGATPEQRNSEGKVKAGTQRPPTLVIDSNVSVSPIPSMTTMRPLVIWLVWNLQHWESGTAANLAEAVPAAPFQSAGAAVATPVGQRPPTNPLAHQLNSSGR